LEIDKVLPETRISCVANVYILMLHFKNKGDIHPGHAHIFDHTTLLSSGSLRVTIAGVASEFKAPQMIYIKANVEHELEALEDNTVASCIHALRDGEGVGDILDPTGVPAGASVFSIAKPLIHT